MTKQRRSYADVDWASESHHVFLTDDTGAKIGEEIFKHGGEGLAEMAASAQVTSGACDPSQIKIAIEVPHGPAVQSIQTSGHCLTHTGAV